MKDLGTKIGIILYSVVSFIYCIVFIICIGSFLGMMYTLLIKELIF